MHLKSSAIAALIVATFVAALPDTASAAPATPAQIAAFKKVEAPFAMANAQWLTALNQPRPNLSYIVKARAPYKLALKVFDSALGKSNFAGKLGSDIATVIQLDKEALVLLNHATTVRQFENWPDPLTPKFTALTIALNKQLGGSWAVLPTSATGI